MSRELIGSLLARKDELLAWWNGVLDEGVQSDFGIGARDLAL